MKRECGTQPYEPVMLTNGRLIGSVGEERRAVQTVSSAIPIPKQCVALYFTKLRVCTGTPNKPNTKTPAQGWRYTVVTMCLLLSWLQVIFLCVIAFIIIIILFFFFSMLHLSVCQKRSATLLAFSLPSWLDGSRTAVTLWNVYASSRGGALIWVFITVCFILIRFQSAEFLFCSALAKDLMSVLMQLLHHFCFCFFFLVFLYAELKFMYFFIYIYFPFWNKIKSTVDLFISVC